MKNRAIFKFNNGDLALLCNKCRTILKTGIDFTAEEMLACKAKKNMLPQYCELCIKTIVSGKKVSFDFDSTLDRPSVQEFAKELIDKGVDVWIISSRMHEDNKVRVDWNKDLFEVADRIGINRNNIILTEMIDKFVYIQNMDLVWHLDDDSTELNFINSFTNTKGISVFGNTTWKNKCLKLLIYGRI